MPNFGGGTGTPIVLGGAPGTGSKLLDPLPYTLLSLSRFAKILGINPVHFWGGYGGSLNPVVMPIKNACDSVWYHYAWQDSDKVSRFDVALMIQNVENEIANLLGFYPAPMWIAGEEHQYPIPYMREYYGTGANIRGLAKGIATSYARIIDVGRRNVTLLGSPTVAGGSLVYTDEDGDGLYETATITMATTQTNVNEVKVYHAGQSGILEWEIRDYRKKSISAGTFTAIFDSCLFIDPEHYYFYPTDAGVNALDISTTTHFVTTVDVYKEYTDTTEDSCEFYWENADVGCAVCGGSGCASCGHITQGACIRIRDAKLGIVSPLPASYDSVTGEWTTEELDGHREPDRVAFWYYAGETSNEYKSTRTYEPLSNRMAMAIAYMATARLERPFCECENVRELSDFLRTDLVHSTGGESWFATRDVMNSPFGTRIGEVKAWQTVSKMMERRSHVAVI